MKQFLLVISTLFFSYFSYGQTTGNVVGTVTDSTGTAMGSVNIYVKNSFTGTTSNKNGNYALELDHKGSHTLVFQYLGFETVEKHIVVDEFPYTLDVVLHEKPNTLDEVVLNAGENPANAIIRKAIAHRKENKAKIKAYTADFYSRGTWTIEDAPEKILGQKVDYNQGNLALDSTRSGIIYLSETRSEIKYKAPDDFHEHVIASKVSGNDNGFSWNSAEEANFSFYENTVPLNKNMISPIADYAFNYYTYELASAFYDKHGRLINKIKVIPKRPANPVFSGYIYIAEESWEIYGIELTTTGKSAQIPPVKKMHINQSFTFSKADQFWVKISQDIHFNWDIFGIKGTGKFIAVYSDYDFQPDFSKDSFGHEVMSYARDANKKDSLFWRDKRPIPLTEEEASDYIKKDSVAKVHHSKVYLDSIDRESNRFSIDDLLFGYHYTNSYRHYYFDISSPLFGTHFNTVQGWNTNVKLKFKKTQEKTHTFWQLYSDMSYGFADHRYRVSGGFLKKFNNYSRPYLYIEGGIKAAEINNTHPIPARISDFANIFYEQNYLKLFDKLYARTGYSQELFNGFRGYAELGFEKRSPLLNATDHVIRESSHGGYTSNNPLEPENFESVPFETHHIGILKLAAKINFDQDYYNYPDGKYNIPTSKYPQVFVNYKKGFAASTKDYDFGQLQLSLKQSLDFGNKGNFSYRAKIGTFFHGKDMAFIDYKHFNGNQTRVAARSSYVGKFNLLPYYGFSTNDHYAEAHFEQNFDGWLLGKIPGVNALNFSIVLGGHALWTGGRKPYQEYSIGLDKLGFGMFRFLRIDYVESIYDGGHRGRVIFGLKFLKVF